MLSPVHFIGVAGIGMRGIAKILLQKGEKVTGSDDGIDPQLLKELTDLGMIYLSEKASLEGRSIETVVYSTIIPENHSQRVWAEKEGKLIHRSKALAALFHQAGTRVAVTGCHGKTTTSSWLAHILHHVKKASFCIGGIVTSLGTSANYGEGDFCVIEADESDGTMVNYEPTHLIVTNLEADHLDYWKSGDRLFAAMYAYAACATHLFLCADDPLLKEWDLPCTTFGFAEEADLRILNWSSHAKGSTMELSWKGRSIGIFETHLWGRHNALNFAAAMAFIEGVNPDEELWKEAACSFMGAKRRLEYLGQSGSMDWYDDYAHHPSEIQASIRAIRGALGPNSYLRLIFQPHRASRLKEMMEAIGSSFAGVDELWLTPLYLAGEKPIEGVDSQNLAKAIAQHSPSLKLRVFRDLEEVIAAARLIDSSKMAIKGCSCTMGAGDITKVGRELVTKDALL